MAFLKAQTAGLLNNVVGSYDQTKTYIAGFVQQRLFAGVAPYLGPNPVKWIDVFTDSGIIPQYSEFTINGKFYAITAIAGGLATVVAYNFNPTSGVVSYAGKITIPFANTAATVHTIHGFKVDDSNLSSLKLFVATTGNVAINGGLYMMNAVPFSAFTPSGVTYSFANGSGQTAMYLLQDSSNIGVGQLNTSSAGLSLDRTNQIAYVHNGVAATHQFWLYDYSLTPNVPQQAATITIASPGVVTATAHGFNANDQVVFTTTGALPTGLVAGTAYFVRNPAANTFDVSATTGGASINTSGSQSGTHAVVRAFGITGSLWKWKTGNLPALSGTLLLLNSEKKMMPGHSTNAGFDCVFFATTTNLYLGKLSELTSGATTWASLITVNLLGTANQVTTPTAVLADWDETLDMAVFTTSTTKIIAKQMINNVIANIFGVLNNDYLEGVSQVGLYTQFGAITVTDLHAKNGWYTLVGSTTGQRGIVCMNSGADDAAGLSYVISPVIDLLSLSNLIGVASVGASPVAASNNDQNNVYYRTSGFGSASGGWILLPNSGLFPPGTFASKIQTKTGFKCLSPFDSNPPFLQEQYVAYSPLIMSSDKWEGSVDNTTPNGGSPAYSAFRQIVTDSGTKVFRAVDDSGSVVASADTSTGFANFDKSTNNGTSWTPMTGPNDYSSTPGTTEIRYKWASPPGVRVTCALGDS